MTAKLNRRSRRHRGALLAVLLIGWLCGCGTSSAPPAPPDVEPPSFRPPSLLLPPRLPLSLAFFEKIPACDPDDPPHGEPALCPPDPPPEPTPFGLTDLQDMIRSTGAWPQASQRISAFGLHTSTLRLLLQQGEPDILDGLERIVRDGKLLISTAFLQDEESDQWSYHREAGECCIDPRSDDYSQSTPGFPNMAWDDTYRRLASFLTDRGLSSEHVMIFIDTFDVVVSTPVQSFEHTPPEQYASEIGRHVADLAGILPGASFYVHEIDPLEPAIGEPPPWATVSNIAAQITALGAVAASSSLPIRGIFLDSISADPREPNDPCRIADEQTYPFDDGTGGMTQLLDLTHQAGLELVAFVVPFIAPHWPNEPCALPTSNADAHAAYVAAAQALAALAPELRPDALVVASWMPQPTRGLPETAPDSVSRAVLDMAALLDPWP